MYKSPQYNSIYILACAVRISTKRTLQKKKCMTKSLEEIREEFKDLEQANCDLYTRLGLLSSLLDNLPGMAFRCLNDEKLTFEYASQGSKKVLGYPADQIVNGYAFRQLVHPEDQITNANVTNNLTPENNRYDLVYRMRASWGEDRWVHEQGTAIFSKEGVLVVIDGLLTDITEQKRKEIKLHEENVRLRSSIKERYRLGSIIGKSPAIQKVYERIIKAASTGATVIINGESGTGKELVARTVHDLSYRKDKPFVAVNCGAITDTLLESEFFGHIKGAFTGAHADRDGFLMAADGGTLFLDEIGEMPVSLQVKLLRVLDGNGFMPVGGNRQCSSDFRLVSATNRDLGEMVRSGRMREDFYYRINTVPISVPPLRERKEDLPLLIEHFVNNFSEESDEELQLAPKFYLTLARHHWPGNVRELQNVIRRYLTLKEICFSPSAQPSSQAVSPVRTDFAIRSLSRGSRPDNNTVRNELAEVETNRIVTVLHENHWHIGKSATVLGISRRTLQRRINKYSLK